MVGTLGRNNTRQRIYRLLRPQPAFHLEPVQPPGGRHGQRLIAIGVERGTHVGIWAANVPDWLTLLYACAKIGAVYVTVNTNYKQSELEYLCQNSDMHTLCIVNGEKDSDFVQMTYTMLPELKTCQRGHLKSERFPYMKNVIYVGQEKHRGM